MIDASGNVVFTKKELVELGIDATELNGVKATGHASLGRRGRPSATFGVVEVRNILEARRARRKAALDAALATIATID